MDYGQDDDLDKQLTTSKEQSAHILNNMNKDVLRDLYLRKLIHQRLDHISDYILPQDVIETFIEDFKQAAEDKKEADK